MIKFKPGQRKSSSGRYNRPDSIPWTQTEIDLCMAMHEDDYGPEDIAIRLRRSVTSIQSKIRCALELRRREEGGSVSKRISAKQEDERDRRKAGYDARDMTSTFFGDPPRGFSALDKQRSQS